MQRSQHDLGSSMPHPRLGYMTEPSARAQGMVRMTPWWHMYGLDWECTAAVAKGGAREMFTKW